MRIEISKLRKLADVHFSYLEELGYDSVEFTHDYYWDIDAHQLYNPYEEPRKLDLGQLSWDLEQLQGLVTGEDDPLPYTLRAFAIILRGIADQIQL